MAKAAHNTKTTGSGGPALIFPLIFPPISSLTFPLLFLLPALVACAACSVVSPAWANGAGEPEVTRLVLDEARLRWSALSFKGNKLLVSVVAGADLRKVPRAELSGTLVEPARGRPVQAGDDTVFLIDFHSRSLRKHLRNRLWFRAGDGAALQRSRLELTRGEERYKQFRYTEEGIFIIRRKPAGGEVERPPASWSRISKEFVSYPPTFAGEQAVSDPLALFYVASVREFAAPGDTLQLLAYFDDALQVITLRYEGEERVDADFELQGRGGVHRIKGQRTVLRLVLSSRPLDQGLAGERGRDGVTLAGLRRPVLLIDRQWRFPLALRGRHKVVGKVDVRLGKAVLK